MFINYITLMLTNLTAGLVLLAAFVYWGLDSNNQKRWIPGFGVTGAIALSTGLHMIWTWPVLGSFNIAYGETSVLIGALFVGLALALAHGWDLITLAIYGFFAGITAMVIGFRIVHLGLTLKPMLSGIGFILTGLGGVCAAPMLHWRKQRMLRVCGAVILLIAALIWAFTDVLALWGHLSRYSNWQPLPMR